MEWDEVGKWKTAAQAFLLLTVFFALILWGGDFHWARPLTAATVKVSLIPAPLRASEPPPKSQTKPDNDTSQEVERLKAEEERKQTQETERKAEEKKKRDADIKRQKEEELKKEEEKRKKEEREKAEEKRKADEAKRKEVEKKKKEKEDAETERKQIEEDRKQQKEEAAQRKAQADARAKKLALVRGNYINRIVSSIEPFLITPPALRGVDNLKVIVELQLDENGYLLDNPQIYESSGEPEYDEEAIRAVLKAAPLPMPKDPELIEEFRNLKLHITPGR